METNKVIQLDLFQQTLTKETRVNFVKYPSKVPWCSDFLFTNLQKHSDHAFEAINPTQSGKTLATDVTHFVNIQLLNKINPFLRKRILINLKKRSKIIAGVRGEFGLSALEKWNKYVDRV